MSSSCCLFFSYVVCLELPTSVLAILIHLVSSKAYNLNLDRRMPAMLLPNPHKIVLPKLGFFQAIILMKSLGNQVVHAFGFLADLLNSYGMITKSVLFLQYDGIPGKKIVVRIHSSASVTFLQNHSTPHAPLHCRMTNSRPFI
ncbi:hypothetical protein Peur_036918 [Populus x canadensis]